MSENPSEREESREQRLNRELDQLLNELRVAMPGMQVLFALPAGGPVPAALCRGQRVSEARLLRHAAGVGRGVGLLHRTGRLHRIVFRERDKPHLIKVSS